MKVEMKDHGVLVISPHDVLEGYALQKWYEDWVVRKSFLVVRFGNEKVHVDPQNVRITSEPLEPR
jgi:hypothetical protein